MIGLPAHHNTSCLAEPFVSAAICALSLLAYVLVLKDIHAKG